MPATRTPGRPREFDRAKALRGAMELFHHRGFDGTTLAELQAAMGDISPPSFYAAFGSKEKVFAEAVDLYQREVGAQVGASLEGGRTAQESVGAMMRTGVKVFTNTRLSPGCLLVFGAVNSATPGLEAMLKDKRCEGRERIRDRILRGIKEGDVPKGANVDAMVSFYSTVMYGLAHGAKDGMTTTMLHDVIDGAVSAWDHLAGPKRATKRRPKRKSAAR